MKCKVCGTEITNPDAVFCPNCGAKLNEAPAPEEKAAAAAAAPAAAAAAAAAAPAAPKPAPSITPSVDPRQNILFNEDWAPIVKTGEWIGSLLLVALVPLALAVIAVLVEQLMGAGVVPTVLRIVAGLSGLLLMFWFAFGKRFNPSKRNFFKAYLILTLICIVIGIVLGVVFFMFIAQNVSSTELTEITDLLKNLT